jgi:thioesterase domain-containing protein
MDTHAALTAPDPIMSYLEVLFAEHRTAKMKEPAERNIALLRPARNDPRSMSSAVGAKPDPLVVPLRRVGSRKSLFFVHGVDGGVQHFAPLADHLVLDRAIYGIRSQVSVPGTRALTRIEYQAVFYTAEIRRVQPQGPYHLVGFSFGGLVALEIAQQLQADGQECGLLGAVDNLRMGSASKLHASEEAAKITGAMAASRDPLTRHLSKVFRPGGIAYAWGKLQARILRIIYTVLDRIGQPIPAIIKRSEDVNWFAAVRYIPRAYSGRVTLFQSSASIQDGRAANDMWEAVARGGIEVRQLPGSHESLLVEPNVINLARAIEASVANLD